MLRAGFSVGEEKELVAGAAGAQGAEQAAQVGAGAVATSADLKRRDVDPDLHDSRGPVHARSLRRGHGAAASQAATDTAMASTPRSTGRSGRAHHPTLTASAAPA